MCGRYTLTTSGQELARQFGAAWPEGAVILGPRYNVAPSQQAPVVRAASVAEEGAPPGERVLASHRWGLVPHWAKDAAIGNRLINARSETAASKPAFRDALRERRCLVPMTGFYEWKRSGRAREPVWFHPPDAGDGTFAWAAAGLWERWWAPDGAIVHSFTVLTTDANAAVAEVHDRMPVLLDAEGQARWLDESIRDGDALKPLFAPFPAEAVAMRAVSTRVNDARAEGPELLAPAEPPAQGELF